MSLMFLSVLAHAQDNRTYDGIGNNLENPEWGSSHSQLVRITTPAYEDNISEPAGSNRLNPREISNLLFDQEERIDDPLNLSDYVWVFGQFLDHDISLVENFDFATNPEESATIIPPFGDPFFSQGDFIPMMRSLASENTGTSSDNVRQHDNVETAFIDASAIYGSSKERADWLRSFVDGKLKVSQGNNLPWNTIDGEFNSVIVDAPFMESNDNGSKFYVAGDVRANENPLLLSMHTLFVREHNLVCDEILATSPSLNDEEVFQLARKIVSGKLQSIVYNEWLPVMGVDLPSYNGYSSAVDPGIFNVFSAAAFRMGHTLINSELIRMRNNGNLISKGNINLKDAFFNPLAIDLAGGVEPYIKGMGTQIQQDFDCKVVGDVRNFLFGVPGQGGLDLAAININRGRERGLPDYNTVRQDFGLPALDNFNELCEEEGISMLLEQIYGDINDVDPWVGMLAEIHLEDALFGELVTAIMERQFKAIRDGDRFFYLNDDNIPVEWKEKIHHTRMFDIIKRNTSIDLMQTEVFRAMDHENIPSGPSIESSDLTTLIYPNPIVDHFYMKTYSDISSEAQLRVYNNQGLMVQQVNVELEEGDNSILIEVDEYLETGFYNIQLIRGEDFAITRFFKM